MPKLMLIILLVLAVSVQAQPPLYRVYQVKGNASLLKSGARNAEVLNKNAVVRPGDKLLLDKAEVILFDRDTNYIRLSINGEYTTAQIQRLHKTHITDNITIRYFELLWEDMFKMEHRAGSFDAEEVANSTGGVSRGLVQFISPMPDFSTSLDKQLFQWRKVKGAEAYTLALRNEEDVLLISRTLADTQVWITLKDSLSYGQIYSWSLAVSGPHFTGQTVATGRLNLVNEQETLSAITMDLPDSLGGVVYDLRRADIYERSGCTKTACSLYQELAEQNKQDPAVQKLYASFLSRTGIKNQSCAGK